MPTSRKPALATARAKPLRMLCTGLPFHSITKSDSAAAVASVSASNSIGFIGTKARPLSAAAPAAPQPPQMGVAQITPYQMQGNALAAPVQYDRTGYLTRRLGA